MKINKLVKESIKRGNTSINLNEEKGPYSGEYYCQEIADRLRALDDYGEVSGVSWNMTINGVDTKEFDCSRLLDILLDDISYSVEDGHLYYRGLDELFYVNMFDDANTDELSHDLLLLNFSQDEIKSFIDSIMEYQETESNDIGEEFIETWIDYDTNFDPDKIFNKLEECTISENIENPLENLRSNILEMPNGRILYIVYKDGNMIAGGATNTGIIPEHVREYDFDLSVDQNLQDFYDDILYSDEILPVEECMKEAFETSPEIIINGGAGEMEVIDKSGDYTILHRVNGGHTPWVVAYRVDRDGDWQHGHYFTNKNDAEEFFSSKCEGIIKDASNFFRKDRVRKLKDSEDTFAPETDISTKSSKESIVDIFKRGMTRKDYSNIPFGRKNAALVDIDSDIDRTRMMAFMDKLPDFELTRNRDSGILSYEYVSPDLDVEFFDTFMTLYRIPQNEGCRRRISEDAFDSSTIYKNDKEKTRLIKADDGYAVVNDKSEWVGTIEAKDDKEAIAAFEKGKIEVGDTDVE